MTTPPGLKYHSAARRRAPRPDEPCTARDNTRVKLFVVVVAVFSVVVSSAIGAAPDAKRMVLGLADLPAGFTVGKGQYVDNTAAAKETKSQSETKTLADFGRWGRLTGYERTFEREGLVGALQLESNASIYKTTQGARDSTRSSFATATNPTPEGWLFKRVSSGGPIGEEARVYAVNVKKEGVDLTVVAVIWRYQTVKAAIFAGGLRGTVDVAEVVRLARKQQARIESALRKR